METALKPGNCLIRSHVAGIGKVFGVFLIHPYIYIECVCVCACLCSSSTFSVDASFCVSAFIQLNLFTFYLQIILLLSSPLWTVSTCSHGLFIFSCSFRLTTIILTIQVVSLLFCLKLSSVLDVNLLNQLYAIGLIGTIFSHVWIDCSLPEAGRPKF